MIVSLALQTKSNLIDEKGGRGDVSSKQCLPSGTDWPSRAGVLRYALHSAIHVCWLGHHFTGAHLIKIFGIFILYEDLDLLWRTNIVRGTRTSECGPLLL